MTSPCPDCLAAATQLWHGQTFRCRGCEVRALAVGLSYFQSGMSGHMTPAYVEGLRKVFGDDWRKGHDDVKAEALRLKQTKEKL